MAKYIVKLNISVPSDEIQEGISQREVAEFIADYVYTAVSSWKGGIHPQSLAQAIYLERLKCRHLDIDYTRENTNEN